MHQCYQHYLLIFIYLYGIVSERDTFSHEEKKNGFIGSCIWKVQSSVELYFSSTVFFKDLFMFLVATLCFSCLPSGWLSMQWQCSFSNFRVHICILHYPDNDSVLVSQENLSLPSNCSKLNSSTIPAQNLWLRRHLTAIKIYSWAGINSFPNTFMPTKKNG